MTRWLQDVIWEYFTVFLMCLKMKSWLVVIKPIETRARLNGAMTKGAPRTYLTVPIRHWERRKLSLPYHFEFENPTKH